MTPEATRANDTFSRETTRISADFAAGALTLAAVRLAVREAWERRQRALARAHLLLDCAECEGTGRRDADAWPEGEDEWEWDAGELRRVGDGRTCRACGGSGRVRRECAECGAVAVATIAGEPFCRACLTAV